MHTKLLAFILFGTFLISFSSKGTCEVPSTPERILAEWAHKTVHEAHEQSEKPLLLSFGVSFVASLALPIWTGVFSARDPKISPAMIGQLRVMSALKYSLSVGAIFCLIAWDPIIALKHWAAAITGAIIPFVFFTIALPHRVVSGRR